MKARRILIVPILLECSLFLGCGAEPATTPVDEGAATALGAPPVHVPVGGPAVAAALSSDGTTDPELQGALKMTGAKGYTRAGGAPGVAARAAAADGRQFVGMVTKQGHYLLEFDAATVNSKFAGLLKLAQPGSATVRGWSNATDSRVRTTGASIPVQQGQVVGALNCSGSLIGRRIVRTAAHCVVSHTAAGGFAVGSVRFDEARDGNIVRATDTTPSFFYGGNYIPNGCATRTATDYWSGYRANLANCGFADWAMLILDTNWYSEAGSISWYGYQGLGASEVGTDLQSGGYPACDDFLNGNGTNNDSTMVEDPAGCRTNPNRFYQDTASARCEIGSFLSNFSRFKAGCDISPGDSGGPVLRRGTGFLLGHVQWQDCGTCTATTNYPNTYLGHDDWLFNFQNQLRNDFP